MKRPLLTFLGLFLLGELAGQWLEENIPYSLGAALAAAGIVWRSNRRIVTAKSRYQWLLLLLFALGALWSYGVRQQMLSREAVASDAAAAGKALSLEGVITEEREYAFLLRTEAGTLRVRGELPEDLRVGDRIRITGVPERIQAATNPGAFDNAAYAESEGIHWQVTAEEIVLTKRNGDWFLGMLDRIRSACREKVEELLPKKEAGILLAMLLGERAGVDKELKELYRQSGIAHVLAISGLHVSLIGAALMALCSLLPISGRKRGALTILFLLLYGALTGFSPSTLRAIWMLSAVCFGRMLRRTSDLPTSAGGALFLILLIQPYRVTSSGMLMSFLAVAGIVAGDSCYRAIFDRERFLFLPTRLRGPFKRLMGMILLSLMLQLFLEPVMLRDYYSVTPYSPLVNLLIVPLLTAAVMSGAVGLLLSFLPGFWNLAEAALLPCRGILRLYEGICRAVSHIPGHEILTGGIGETEALIAIPLILAVVYVIWRLLRGRKRKDRKWSAYLLTLLLITAFYLAGALYASLRNRWAGRIIFLDVGQGDGCIVHTKNGTDLLFDCGSSSKETVGTDVLIPALRYYGIRELDGVFLSHSDTDHISGVQQLLEQGELYGIRVDRILLGAGTVEDENLKRLSEAAEAAGTKVHFLRAGDALVSGETTVRVLLPREGESGEGNDYSMVNCLTVPGCSVLFTGDIGAEREAELAEILREAEERTANNSPEEDAETSADVVRILKVPHHGSRFSSSEQLLSLFEASDTPIAESNVPIAASNAPIAVISCGRRNIYGHPAGETLERLEKAGFTIYRTDQNGAVIVELP